METPELCGACGRVAPPVGQKCAYCGCVDDPAREREATLIVSGVLLAALAGLAAFGVGFWWLLSTLFLSPESPDEGANNDFASYRDEIKADREAGRAALDEADTAIRRTNAEIADEFRRKAVRHQSSGRAGLDVYEMSDGRIVTCRTSPPVGSTPAVMNCDGAP